MKKLVSFVLLLALFASQVQAQFLFPFPGPGGGSLPPIQLVTHSGAAGLNSATTTGVDTTGANLIVISAGAQVVSTVSDSKGNTWIPLALNNGGQDGPFPIQQWYCFPCTVGSSHTFTQTDSGGAGTIFMMAFSGVATPPVEQQGGDTGTGTLAGAVSPLTPGCAIVTTAIANSTITSVDSGFTITDNFAFSGGNNFGGAGAYQIQTAATARQPQWVTAGGGGVTTITVFRNIPPNGSYILSTATVRGVTGGTTIAINTTGANLLVAFTTGGNGVTPTISDSKSNTWTGLNLNTNAGCCSGSTVKLWYVASPTVGSGHTFTLGGASVAGTLIVVAMTAMNASPLDVQDGGTGTSTTNTITTTANGDWIFAGYMTSVRCASVTNGFLMVSHTPTITGSNYTGCLAFLPQTSAGAISTAFAASGAAPSSIAAFKHQ